MKRKNAIFTLGVIITLLVLAFVWNNANLSLLTEQDALDAIRELYPDLEDYSVTEGENCTGVGDECWIFNINTTRSGDGEMKVNKKDGELTDDVECTEWYCETVYCTYESVEMDGSVVYYNYGCDNPIPTCDAGLGECRECYIQEDCVRKKALRFLTQTPTQELTRYEFEIIGSAITGDIDDLSMECHIYDDGVLIYSQNQTIEGCESEITSRAVCGLGLCGA